MHVCGDMCVLREYFVNMCVRVVCMCDAVGGVGGSFVFIASSRLLTTAADQ